MRQFSLFLIASLIAVSAHAQPSPASPANPAASVDTGFTADGKIKLGYEGRGDYRKPKKLPPIALQSPDNNKTAASATPSVRTTPPTVPAAASPVEPAPQTASSEKVKKLRSDSDLKSDMAVIREKREAARAEAAKAQEKAAATNTANAATVSTTATNAQPIMNAPMVLVGGQIVQQ